MSPASPRSPRPRVARFLATSLAAGRLLGCALVLAACAPKPIPVPTGADAPCAQLAYQGFPRLEPGMKNSYFACHTGFALQYAVPLRSPLWVAHRLDAAALDEKLVSRDNEAFRPDPRLPKGITLDPKRYSRTGYDRGHMAPAADFAENAPAMSQSFYTSNIVPQDPGNNRGVWVRLENNVRQWARMKGELYVVTGPVYFANAKPYTPMGWLHQDKGKNSYVIESYQRTDDKSKERRKARARAKANAIAVPSHLFKVIYDPRANTAVAFVVPNLDVPEQNLGRYATTVAQVEQITHLRFFPQMPMDQQAQVKTTVDPNAWPLVY